MHLTCNPLGLQCRQSLNEQVVQLILFPVRLIPPCAGLHVPNVFFFLFASAVLLRGEEVVGVHLSTIPRLSATGLSFSIFLVHN